jgi:hypothetical protein
MIPIACRSQIGYALVLLVTLISPEEVGGKFTYGIKIHLKRLSRGSDRDGSLPITPPLLRRQSLPSRSPFRQVLFSLLLVVHKSQLLASVGFELRSTDVHLLSEVAFLSFEPGEVGFWDSIPGVKCVGLVRGSFGKGNDGALSRGVFSDGSGKGEGREDRKEGGELESDHG